MTKRALINAHRRKLSIVFGNVKHSRKNLMMIALRLWKRKNCVSHVSVVAIKSKIANHGNVVPMVMRRFPIDCSINQSNRWNLLTAKKETNLTTNSKGTVRVGLFKWPQLGSMKMLSLKEIPWLCVTLAHHRLGLIKSC